MGVRGWLGRVLGGGPADPPRPAAPVAPSGPPAAPPPPPSAPPPPPPSAPPPPAPPPPGPAQPAPTATEFDALRADPGLPATLARDVDAARADLILLADLQPRAAVSADAAAAVARARTGAFVRPLTAYALWLRGSRFKAATRAAQSVATHLDLPSTDGESWTVEELAWLLAVAARGGPSTGAYDLARWTARLLPSAEALPPADLGRLVDPLRAVAITLLAPGALVADAERDVAAAARRTADLVARAEPDRLPVDALTPGDAYGDAARATLLAERPEPDVAGDLTVLRTYPDAVQPSARWRTGLATALGAHPGLASTARTLLEPLPDLLRPSRTELDTGLRPGDLRLVRAAVWVLADLDEPWVAPTLGAIGLGAGIGPGGRGAAPRQAGLTSTVVAALAQRAGHRPTEAAEAIAQLSRIQQRVANRPLRKAVGTALAAVAEGAGLTAAELVERSVPDLGLDADGHAEVLVGDHTAVLRLRGPATAATLTTTWRTPGGGTLKTAPAAVRTDHPEAVAALRATAKDAKQLAALQRSRLEDLMAVERGWVGADWVAAYVDQPLVGLTARGLIWQARTGGGPWRAGLPERGPDGWTLRGLDDAPVAVGAGDQVRLWHPIREPLEEVSAWRARVTFAGLRQPFKQAFRETYRLTPAEGQTGTYSNRFAGHVLRYLQAGALMRTRGWSATHLGYWDGGYDGEATRAVGEEGWRATLYYTLVERDEDASGEVTLCSTDQVRFERPDDGGAERGARPLGEVPPLVFSEAMRDVDLFVGVTSVGADPEWADRGTDRFAAYWDRASFGALTESAEVRRDALARLLPRTAIADRVELTERFLVVHGALRDYRIHLGSGNVLMSPADTYLCIVPARTERGPTVYLPFEEDGGRLSLIVSKAFLLADDTAITDPTILAQLRLGL